MRRPAAAGAVCRLACTLAVQLGLPLGLYLAFHSARCAPDITRWFLFNFGAMGFAALSELIAVTNIGGLAFDAAVLYVLSAATQFGLAIWCAARALPWGRNGGERETRAPAWWPSAQLNRERRVRLSRPHHGLCVADSTPPPPERQQGATRVTCASFCRVPARSLTIISSGRS